MKNRNRPRVPFEASLTRRRLLRWTAAGTVGLAAGPALSFAANADDGHGNDGRDPVDLDAVALRNLRNVTIHAPDDMHNYAHCPSLEFFGGKFYAAWQGGPQNKEGGVQQGIPLTESADFQEWTPARMVVQPERDQVLFAPVLWTHDDRLWLF